MMEEFVRLINLTEIGKGPVVQSFDASESERKTLAARFSISELRRLSGRFQADIDLGHKGGVVLEGEYDASLVQQCRYTLEPVVEEVQEHFRVLFLPDLPQDELAWDDIDEGDLERLEGESIDAGEIIAQYLGMSINPYPQKNMVGAHDLTAAAGHILSEEEANEAASPFASLKKIKDKL